MQSDTLRDRIYDLVYTKSLEAMFRLRPERIHHTMMDILSSLSHSTVAATALRSLFSYEDPVLAQNIAGLEFPRPLGLAAGFDKDATAANIWGPLGFGFAEVGTVTAVAQPGNPTPRLFRLPDDRAILNRMGFNNQGATAAAQLLAGYREVEPIGVNLGKTKITDPAVAENDYRQSARTVNAVADYLVINVSSPNTPGLRDLQAVDSLRRIISAVREETRLPLFVKMAPDLADADIDAVTELAVEQQITGLITTNTTISRAGLSGNPADIAALGAGGISGAPLHDRAIEVLKRVADRADNRLVLIGVGGIETAEQAWERIGAGAHLLQGYTAFIYHGPDWTRRIHRGLAEQVRAHGLPNISTAVGRGLPWITPS